MVLRGNRRHDDYHRRRSDQSLRSRLKFRARENWYRDVWLLIVSGIVLYTVVISTNNTQDAANLAFDNRQLLLRFESDSISRRDESCRYFELQEAAGIQRVRGTYSYLDHLPRSEWGSSLTKAIVLQLPSTYTEAVANKAPSYCNEKPGQPQVGLPETGKRLPAERDFSFMLRKSR